MSEVLQNIFLILGGLGLFFYGMKIMSESLGVIAGDRLRTFLEKATSNRFLAILVGSVATFITNSSSATTIMVVGFINSRLMNLTQALGVIMGANIGTTLTAQMLAFKIDSIAPLCIFIGLVMHMFFKKKSIKNLGHIILGFGILFFGITVMGAPLEEFAKQPSFQTILTTFENPWLALLAGLAFTAIIQSSSATTAILVAMYLSGIAMPFKTAAFIILGSNIGTCSDSLIASVAGNRESKRAALGNIIFKITGSIVFGSLILLFPGILSWIQESWPEGARQVAMFHTLFNVCTVILFIPFIKQFSTLMQKIIPLKPDEISNNYEKKLIYLTPDIIQSPSIAAANAHLEFCRMGQIARDNLELALDAFYSNDLDKANKTLENEKVINYLNHNITSYLVSLRGLNLSDNDMEKMGKMLRALADVERIGDHAENIAEYVLLEEKSDIKFSEIAIRELKKLSETTLKIVKLSLDIYEKQDKSQLPQIEDLEKNVDDMSKQYTENHIERLIKENCNPRAGVIFTDMIIDLERCADHATNISYSIVNKKVRNIKSKKALQTSTKKAK